MIGARTAVALAASAAVAGAVAAAALHAGRRPPPPAAAPTPVTADDPLLPPPAWSGGARPRVPASLLSRAASARAIEPQAACTSDRSRCAPDGGSIDSVEIDWNARKEP